MLTLLLPSLSFSVFQSEQLGFLTGVQVSNSVTPELPKLDFCLPKWYVGGEDLGTFEGTTHFTHK